MSLPHLRPRLRVKAGRRFVKKQDLRVIEQAHGDVQLARHAARVRAHQTVGGLGQVEALERLQRLAARSSRPDSP